MSLMGLMIYSTICCTSLGFNIHDRNLILIELHQSEFSIMIVEIKSDL